MCGKTCPCQKTRQLGGFGCAMCQNRIRTLGYLGATGSQIAAGASTGAAVGSAIPVIGTAIGAIVGGLAAQVSSMFKHDVRVSGADRAACTQAVNQYLASTAQANGMALGPTLGIDKLHQLNWCLASIYGSDINNVDPRFFQIAFEMWTKYITQMVRLVMTAPPGSTVQLDAVTGTSSTGKNTFTSPAYPFTIPQQATIDNLTDAFMPIVVDGCKANAGKYAGGCSPYYSHPGFKALIRDLIAFVVNRDYPNVGAQAAAAAAPVAAPAVVPVTVAPAPVATPAVTTPVVSIVTTPVSDSTPVTQTPVSYYTSPVQTYVDPNSGVAAPVTQNSTTTPATQSAGMSPILMLGLALIALPFIFNKKAA